MRVFVRVFVFACACAWVCVCVCVCVGEFRCIVHHFPLTWFFVYAAMKLILQRAQIIGGVGDRQLALLHDNSVWLLDDYQIR